MNRSYESVGAGLARAKALGLIVLLGTAIGAALALAGCTRGTASGPQAPPSMPVKVQQQIADSEVGNTSEYVATIKSRNSATIMSDVEGWIFDIHVHSGELGEEGRHPDGDRSAAAAGHGFQLGIAASLQTGHTGVGASCSWNAPRALYASGVVSKQDLDQAQSNLRFRSGRREVPGRADHASSRCS